MIGVGAAVVQQWYWVLYIFAAFLVLTGIKMLFAGDKPMDVAGNPVVKFISRHMRVTPELHGEHFFVKVADDKTGKLVRAATPLFLALVVINLADLVFAVDSVPAIFAITTDTFIVYTSNIMAILGLRALYFASRRWCTAFITSSTRLRWFWCSSAPRSSSPTSSWMATSSRRS
jgi:tellurite resistance protein TerC